MNNLNDKDRHIQLKLINLIIVTGRCYWYKNNYYEKVGEILSKNTTTGEWEEHFTYKNILKEETYSRHKVDFALKFDKIDKQILTLEDLKL